MNTATASRTSEPRPFLPSDLPRDRLLPRAVAAHCVAAARGPGVFPGKICQQFWPRDAASLMLIERSATAPATTTTAGWAAELAAHAIASFVGSLQDSAAAKLIMAGQRFEMPGVATITLPRASSTGGSSWVLEGAPVPVVQATIAGPQLGPPKKLAIIEAVSREIADLGPDDAEGVLGTILRDSLSRQLDASLFDASPGTAARPPGLLYGLAGQTATVGGGVNAALGDLRLLVDSVVSGGGSGNIMFFSSPGRALVLRAYAPELADRVFGSVAIPGATLIAVDVNAFCSMFGPDPELRASKESVLHFEDSVPLQISSPGAPPTVAAPSRSLFQTDSIALRAILKAAWALRVPGGASFISTGMSW